MKKTDLKTIDITTLVWFDRTCGNSYFAQVITLNYGLNNAEVYKNPFRYGYDSYNYEAFLFLAKHVFVDFNGRDLSLYCDERNIIIRSCTHTNCRKRELINI